MTVFDKLMDRLQKNPENLNYCDIEKILLEFGFTMSQGKGSHRKFFHPNCEERIVIPIHNNDCKKIYKTMVSKVIKKYFL